MNEGFLAGQYPVNVAFVAVDDNNRQNTGDGRQNPVVNAEGDDKDSGDTNDTGSTGHTRQQQGGDEDRAGNAEQRRVIGKQDPGTGGDRLAAVEMVKD